MRKLILLFCLIAASPAIAQSDKTKKACSCSFSNITQVGLMEGERKGAFTIQTIMGMRYKTWFAGVGAGLDHYFIRGFPVFFDLRKNILNKPSTPFVYTDIGVHFGWGPKAQFGDNDYNAGLYYDVGAGYRTAVNKRNAIVLSAGYSFKNVKQTTRTPYCNGWGPCQEYVETYEYDLRRLSLKIGWQF